MAAPRIEDYSAFEFVDVADLRDGRKLGILHPDAPAEGFRFAKQIDAFVPFGIVGDGFEKVINFSWKIQLRTGTQPDAPVQFEQTVTLPVQIIVFAESGAIGFAFWAPLDQRIDVETSIVNGQAVPQGPFPGSTDPGDPQTHYQGWTHTDDSSQTEYSEEPILDFAFSDTALFTVNGIYVRLTYYSAPYLQSVAPGMVFDAVFDTAGIGRYAKESDYLVSFKTAPGIGRWLDTLATWHLAMPGTVNGAGGIVINQRTMRSNNPLAPLRNRAFLPAMATPALCKTSDGVLWLLARDRGGASFLHRSEDDGLTFERATVKNGGVESDLNVFPSGYILLDVSPCPQGGVYELAASEGQLFLQRYPKPFEQDKAVGALRSGETYRLGVERGRAAAGTIFVMGATHAYRSDDEFTSPATELEG